MTLLTEQVTYLTAQRLRCNVGHGLACSYEVIWEHTRRISGRPSWRRPECPFKLTVHREAACLIRRLSLTSTRPMYLFNLIGFLLSYKSDQQS